MTADTLRIAGAQMAPVWLDRNRTLAKVISAIHGAADDGVQLLVFPEAFVPGYPWWIEWTDGARFDAAVQKSLHAHYLDQAVQIEAGHLDEVCAAIRDRSITVVLGVIERPLDRGGHSVYASLVTIDAAGTIVNVHRKLMPTYEERLSWAPGDGHGLRTHRVGAFTLGALNCWENWMPLARASLYGQGEDLHVAIWPGSVRNTEDITRFMAREGRSYVMSVSGLLRRDQVPEHTPHFALLQRVLPEVMGEGGSCIAGPDAQWIVAPVAHEERLITADIDHTRVREERQNFDAMGHYGRPDVLQLEVNRERQRGVRLRD
ncbi:carbon-nitrogen hydrolase family protein [Gemmatimonas groenlandica]|uniref:Carbon-nitrogen hydrolase family protein n=1 Tax=Gemmatimonas groenlandica TaxID=2732249 RepID=A0A6M4IWL9_9BACT|nr:carbon-nitrogen hydrolase family protein [Gemmatimonas groenlandica]QJR36581.1 carbon-nitrogen hydrolase family protein [Gemmatimonas groenlandica]